MIYLRVLNSDVWMDVVSKERVPIDSDVISDLSTKQHQLSVWEIDESLTNLDDIVLAMALTRNEVKDLTIVKLSPIDLKEWTDFNSELKIEDQIGITGYKKMANSHKNFMIYTLWEMKYLAEYISEIITKDLAGNCLLYNTNAILKILKVKIDSGVIDQSEIKSNYGKWLKAIK